MAIFTNSNRITGDYELDTPSGYEGSVGASQMFIESVQNDLTLFEALITNDFREVSLLNESASQDQVEALLEASAPAFIERIKEFLKKAWEKIKALVEAFITNLMNVVIRDNKKFVEKYKSEVLKKDLSKMKFKWSECKASKDEVFSKDPVATATETFNTLNKTSIRDTDVAFLKKVDDPSFKENEYIKAFNTSETGTKLYNHIKEEEFADKDEHTGLSDRLRDDIMDVLVNSSKILTALKKIKSDIDKIYTKRLKEVDDYKNKSAGMKSDSDIDIDGVKAKSGDMTMRRLNALYKYCSVEQEVAKDSISIAISLVKWRIKECRAVFARAASFNAKLVKETDDDLLDAEDEAEEHELEEAFEGIYAY